VTGGDPMFFNVDATGTVTLEDLSNYHTQTITGVSFLIFQDAATASPDYSSGRLNCMADAA